MAEFALVGSAQAVSAAQRPFMDERERLAAFREELDGYYKIVEGYAEMEPDQVLLSISGIAARLNSIRADLVRSGSGHASSLRTREVDPFLEHLDMQHKLHSRVQACREFDWRVANGQP